MSELPLSTQMDTPNVLRQTRLSQLITKRSLRKVMRRAQSSKESVIIGSEVMWLKQVLNNVISVSVRFIYCKRMCPSPYRVTL